MDTLQKQTKQAIQSGTVDWTGYIQKGTDIITSFQTALLPYIATEKIDLFSAFIQARLKALQVNTLIKTQTAKLKQELKEKAEQAKQQIQEKKKEMEKKLEQAKKDREVAKEQAKKDKEQK
jgi:hypothetical protein